MEAMASFFESINKLLGVSGPGELVFHPVFIGLCIAIFIYSLIKGYKFMSVGIFLVMGGAIVFHYLWPEDTSNLTALVKFMAAMGGLALVCVYLAIIRE